MVPKNATPSAGQVQVRERRFQASAVALTAATLLVLWVLSPVWQPLLFAAMFAASLFGLQEKLTKRLRGRSHAAAGLLTLGVILLILTPLAILATIAIREAIDAFAMLRELYRNFRTGGVDVAVAGLPDGIERVVKSVVDKLPVDLTSLPATGAEASRWAAGQVQSVVATVATFSFDLLMMLISMFFFLAEGRLVVQWLADVSPMGPVRTRELLHEFRAISRSIVGSNFITGAVQAAVATGGYYIAQVPQALFFGLLTLLTSFLPPVGTAFVSVPLVGLLLLTGHPWAALFLGLWSMLAVGLVDNLLRPFLMRGELHVHGVVLFFVIVGGMAVFGFAGVLVGPIALAFFLSMVRFVSRDLHPEGGQGTAK